MKTDALPPEQRSKAGGGKFVPALCNFLGTLILLTVILTAVPLSVPRFLGYEVYSVVSGSMEPEIPVGSVVYVKALPPETVQADEVIAFWSGGSVVTHRVVRNQFVEGVFVTKGDANDMEDINSVPYSALIGRVERHYPLLGRLLMIYASDVGKVYMLVYAICGVMFNILAGRMREHAREKRTRDLETEIAVQMGRHERRDPKPEGKKKTRRNRRRTARTVLMILLLAVFLTSGGAILVIQHQYKVSDALYESAADQYTLAARPAAPAAQGESPAEEQPKELAPITVDFDALLAANSDIVGWIYCEGTPINYPILQTEDNDYYLHRGYDREYRAAGSIFVEAANHRDFADSNTIIYGHHMRNGSMFASLENWSDQSYFDEHPVMWLLTPTRDYKIVLFSSYTTSALSDTYTIFSVPGMDLNDYLQMAVNLSDVRAEVPLYTDAHYVLLSTCAYVFDYARSVVHGILMPVDSAGGAPLA